MTPELAGGRANASARLAAALRAPFPAADIEWRLQQAGETNGKVWGRVLAYITNRAIMDRLDQVVGPDGWQNSYAAGPAGGILCGLSLRVGEEWVTKWDGAENTDTEPVKGGLSSAMKRAAVQWGIGRYLYELDAGWAVITEAGRFAGKTKTGRSFRWEPPALPAWALPATTDVPVRRPALGTGTAQPEPDDVEQQVAAAVARGVGDLAAARAFPLPWRRSDQYGQPLDNLSRPHLEAICEWCEQGDRLEAPGNAALHTAASLLLADLDGQAGQTPTTGPERRP